MQQKNGIVKRDVYNAKIKNSEDKIPKITKLATNASLNAKINEIEGEVPSTANLTTNASLNAKINEVNDEIPNITNLATTTALTAVENKIPNVSNIAKKVPITHKLVKLSIKSLLIMIMRNILLVKNSISLQQICYFKISTSKFRKQK